MKVIVSHFLEMDAVINAVEQDEQEEFLYRSMLHFSETATINAYKRIREKFPRIYPPLQD